MKAIRYIRLWAMAFFSVATCQSFTGDGTFYYPAGGYGACGSQLQNSDAICAVSVEQYGTELACGVCLEVTGPKGSVIVHVMDKCAACKSGDVDLSYSAFILIADEAAGRVTVNSKVVDCPSSSYQQFSPAPATSSPPSSPPSPPPATSPPPPPPSPPSPPSSPPPPPSPSPPPATSPPPSPPPPSPSPPSPPSPSPPPPPSVVKAAPSLKSKLSVSPISAESSLREGSKEGKEVLGDVVTVIEGVVNSTIHEKAKTGHSNSTTPGNIKYAGKSIVSASNESIGESRASLGTMLAVIISLLVCLALLGVVLAGFLYFKRQQRLEQEERWAAEKEKGQSYNSDEPLKLVRIDYADNEIWSPMTPTSPSPLLVETQGSRIQKMPGWKLLPSLFRMKTSNDDHNLKS